MSERKLEDGYYLSTYLEIDPVGNLFMYAQRHDQSIALWKVEGNTVTLVHYWELERRSGYKHNHLDLYSVEQCKQIIQELLKEHDLNLSDIKEIWGTPQLEKDRSYLSIYDYPEYTYHGMCHLSSSLFMDMDLFCQENILAFTVDGGSDNVLDKDVGKRHPFFCAYKDRESTTLKLAPVYTPGLMWNYMTEYSGLLEGTLMALASAGTSRVLLSFDDILCNDSANEKYVHDQLMKIIKTIEELSVNDIGTKFTGYDPRFSEWENKLSMMMKVVQDMSFHIMERNVEEAVERFHIDTTQTYLAMSGGFSLNCPTNTHLMKKYRFKGFIAPPCVSDTGIAMGCGLFTFYKRTAGNFHFKLDSAMFGDEDNLDDFIRRAPEFQKYIESIEEFDPDRTAEDIIHSPVVWFDGRAEIGPRALGGRSIIADPRYIGNKDKLNEIKLRQKWRPVAPIIRSDEIDHWFDEGFESPFMLHTFTLKKDKRQLAPAIMHTDGSARVQTLADDGSRLSCVLNAFNRKTGVPIICNTSLNDRGEPIINRIEEAINFCLRKGIRICYVNGKRLVLKNHGDYLEHTPYPRPLKNVYWREKEERERLKKELNVSDVEMIVIFYYILMKVNDIDQFVDPIKSRILDRSARVYLNSLPELTRNKILTGLQKEIV